MSIIRFIFTAACIIILLSSCSSEDEPAGQEASVIITGEGVPGEDTGSVEQLESTETAVPTEAPTEEPTLIPTNMPTTEPTVAAPPKETPTEAPTQTPEMVDNCLACHTDKEQLVQTAAPEEKAPSESSGVG